MVYRYLLLMLAVVAGIFLWPADEVVNSRSAAGREYSDQYVATNQSLARTVVEGGSPSENTISPYQGKVLNPLAEASGNALVEALESFWQECQQRNDCEQLLVQLQAELSDARYQLLARYPQLKAQWQEVMGELELNQYHSLVDRIAEMKRQALFIWGELASVMFAEEYALYDFSLASQDLATDNAESYVESYEALLTQWQHNEESLSLDSGAARYEKGVSLIPSTFTQQQKDQVKAQLAAKYLNAEQSASIAQREQQVASQEVQVVSYQSQLSDLKQSLDQQRSTAGSAMSDLEWQQYVEQKISDFRINFFNYN
ncbi:chromosome segregation ATPase [Vibrio coralliilyticus]|uniref:chromosome segregation ATPase n=1 Tax=Vibrio coralliilyticus TaxID=190893 RepID=UPI001560E82F|nr:chromosome segregation ATPase [Vibrio coralliilyticus]NRF29826.1 chromosome segregation ATPase [Vibrio coralliilyticus]NRF52022.1 chromosome segregation ATPase [Vibrio coralliilyticus]NRG01635.1 chromosome segregation ATPase [Vibrio coralliilyticus]